MRQARTKRLTLSLLTSAIVLASVSQINAEMIFFANGRTMSVRDYRVAGDVITVTLRHGGEASFDRALVTHIAPDEVPEPDAAAVVPTAHAPAGLQPLAARPFADLIQTVSLKHGIDPALVHAVVQAESNYRPTAKSHAGARGLMQLMPATAKDFGIQRATTLFDPQANLEAGVQYLKFLLARFDLDHAIAAYNAGPGAVRKYAGIPPFRETQDYVRKVRAFYGQ
ncbi:MAG: lytic transglycosylase domain-containing protein [Acidobacteria bacterium]|nr:lytic transglycosylase domain-containing protein [Acidobacteriota bacterium]